MTAMATKLIVLAGFMVAFAAGLVTGFQQQPSASSRSQGRSATGPATGPSVARGPTTRRITPPPPPSILANWLNLEPQQRTQLEAIWREVAMLGVREMEQRRREIRQKREESVEALLEEQAAEEYRQILNTYAEEMTALENQWWEAYRNGVEKTKAILNPQQVEKFEQIMRRNTWNPERSGRGGRGRGGPGGGGRGGPENRENWDGGRNDNRGGPRPDRS